MSGSFATLLWIGAIIWTAIGALELFGRLCLIFATILEADFWNRKRRNRR